MDPLPLSPGRSILCLRPNVSREAAIREFAAAGFGAALARMAHGPLQRLAAVYIPYRLYRVEWQDGGVRESRYLALDCVRASFDLYAFPAVPPAESLQRLHTRNHPEPAVPEAQTGALILEHGRRLAYGRGLLRLRDLRLSAELVIPELHIPYWAGFFGRDGQSPRVRVLDAVRRSLEGAKLCGFVREWLAG